VDFQKIAKTWAGRGVLLVLVLAFAAWGIGDVLRGGGGGADDVAVIGEESITAQQLQNEFRRDLQRMQQRNPNLTTEDAHRQRLYVQTLLRLVGQSLIAQEADQLGVVIPDELVRREIADEPNFHDDQGRFDMALYEQTLQRNNLSPERYEELTRNDLRRDQLLGTVAASRPAPTILAEAVYRVRQEQRNALVAIVPRDDTLEVPDPDEATIEAFHQEHAAQFTAPEYRTITLLRLTPALLVDTIELSDDDLLAEYEERVAEFELPEQRTVEQVLVNDRALIDEAAALLQQGQDFDAMATAMTAKGATVNVLNDVAKDRLPAEVGEIVFGLAEGGVSEPLETAFGHGIFRVKEVKPARTRPFEEVRDELHKEMSFRLAADSMIRLANTIEDELAGGANVQQAAAAVGVDTVTLTFDAAGLDKDGNEVLVGEAEREDVVVEAFSLEPQTDTGLRESKEGTAFVAHLDAVEPSVLRPLEDVRDSVVAAWRVSERMKQAEAKADALVAAIEAGEPLADAAAEAGYEAVELSGLVRNRPSRQRGSTAAIERELFAQDPDKPTPIVDAIPQGYAVAMLRDRVTPDANAAAAEVQQLAGALGQQRNEDLSIAYQAALEKRYGVGINQGRIEALFGPQS
jgi:peptidyl-prolyl cis-trans isomerase D